MKDSNPLYKGLDDEKVIKEINSIIVKPSSLFKSAPASKNSYVSIMEKYVNITIISKN